MIALALAVTARATVQAIVTYATEWLARIDGDDA